MKFQKKILFFVGHFCPPGSGSGYGFIDLIESGSNPDLDPSPKTVDNCTSAHYSTVVLGSGLKWVDGSVGEIVAKSRSRVDKMSSN